MKYRLVLSDRTKDERVEMEVYAENVFDAINIAASLVDNPAETELIEATPVQGE